MTAFTAQQLTNPEIAPATLAEIVNTQPEMWAIVQAHPNCYPALAAHIGQHLATLGVAQVAQVAPVAPVAPVAQAAPTTLAAPATPADPAAQPQPASGAGEQVAAGAKLVAAGAKDYFLHTVTPAAKRASASIQQAAHERGVTVPETKSLHAWAPIAVPACAFIAILSLFLPIGSISAYGYSASVNFFAEEAGGEGVMLLISMLVVIAGSGAALVVHRRWVRITAGVIGILFGLIAAIDGFGTMANINGASGASVGAGSVLLAASATGLLVAAVVTLLPKK
ncbi:hypothetical protein JOF28_001279 [Leucobacter exalbidus]|uniref:Leucine rich repeat variant domain-containing protein n=1 Tax=Leucobacter exalbidus TaxID=662960 RepID=A0A940PLC3_9MICO|nr:hypothetical protein [Leucobacter exalbidus]MBP1326047.1 hypothetical protein [Leucobacter exalbidus]